MHGLMRGYWVGLLSAPVSYSTVQDTVYKAIKYYKKFKQNTNLRGWLTAIMKNTFINQYHKNKSKNNDLNIDEIKAVGISMKEPSLFSCRSTLNSARKHSLSDCYNLCLNNLPKELQTLMTLCDVEGFSYSQIADFFKCPIGTVRTRLYRGRKSMLKTFRKLYMDGQF